MGLRPAAGRSPEVHEPDYGGAKPPPHIGRHSREETITLSYTAAEWRYQFRTAEAPPIRTLANRDDAQLGCG